MGRSTKDIVEKCGRTRRRDPVKKLITKFFVAAGICSTT